ncbi:hypothetical protein [Roseovarius aestuariivivens]|uniref:hypothetical protein n=1 Tax=Roseovarius aestuariivivens TaxID=1888910 RepID=UPI0010822927|nr:hypothetical protein [Roseovarius aestuariivivens]
MRNVVSVLVISTVALSGCSGWSDSRANPRNWFGKSQSTAVVERATPREPGDRQTGNPLITEPKRDGFRARNRSTLDQSGVLRRRNRQEVYEGTLIDEVTALRIERIPTGAIVHVTGLPQREGAFDVRLVEVNPDGPVNGVMEYTLNAYQPVTTRQGTPTTRRVETAVFIPNGDLEQVREIRVTAERNRRSSNRR